MDCKTFEDAVLDLIYEDDRPRPRGLDDARRHVDGCGRCAGMLSTLRRGRELSTFSPLPLPEGLETRILDAAEAQDREHRGSWLRRIDRAISFAGAYAMRPQAAMSALMLLMVGSSLLLLRARPAGPGAVRITEHGVPAAEQPPSRQPAASSTAALDRRASPEPRGARRDDDRERSAREGSPRDREPIVAAPDTGGPPGGGKEAPADSPPPALAAAAPPAAPPAAMATAPAAALPGAGAVADAPAAPAASAPPPQDAAFADAMDDFRGRRFTDAIRGFDIVANGGGSNAPSAALYAARSTRYSSGCGAALPRFDAVASRYVGTSVAAEASWDAASCYREVGQIDRARQLFQALRRVAGYRDRAEKELAALDQRFESKKAAARPAADATAKPAAPPSK